jgi:hypothetical protein
MDGQMKYGIKISVYRHTQNNVNTNEQYLRLD